MNHELPDVQAGFRKGRGTRDQIANIHWIIKKAREFQKNIYFALLTMPKPLTVWMTANCGKFFKRWEYQTTWPASWEICISQVKKQQLESDMEQWTSSKFGKDYIKAVYCHAAYLTYMQSTSCKILGWMKHKLESRLPGEISVTSDIQIAPLLWQKMKSLLIKVKEESEKLIINIQKTKIMASNSITSWQIDGDTIETVTHYFLGSKITADGDCSHEV